MHLFAKLKSSLVCLFSSVPLFKSWVIFSHLIKFWSPEEFQKFKTFRMLLSSTGRVDILALLSVLGGETIQSLPC